MGVAAAAIGCFGSHVTRLYNEVNVEWMKVSLVRFICAVNTGLIECVSFIQ